MSYEVGQVRAQAWGLRDGDDTDIVDRMDRYWQGLQERVEKALGHPVRLEPYGEPEFHRDRPGIVEVISRRRIVAA